MGLYESRTFLPLLATKTENSTWNVYDNFDQYLRYDPETGEGWGVFGRIGLGDEDTNPIPFFVSAGIGDTGIIPGLPLERFGHGYDYLEVRDKLPGLLLDDEQGTELFCDVAVAPWLRVGANFQFIEPALRTAESAMVFGLRSTISFQHRRIRRWL